MKVVIDTNVFVSSFFGDIPGEIIDLWKDGEITLCVSPGILNEYIEILARLGLEDQERDELLWLFAKGVNTVFIENTPDLNIVLGDPDDDKFIECAVAINSKIIVSSDKHLKSIKKYVDIEIMSPREFITYFKKQIESTP